MNLEADELLQALQSDRELLHKLRELTGSVRLDFGDESVRIEIVEGRPESCRESKEPADIAIRAPREFWEKAMTAVPEPGYECPLSPVFFENGRIEGDLERFRAPYQGAIQRLFQVLRRTVAAPGELSADPEPWRETDDAVGRYRYVRSGDREARVYYEESGAGPIPLVLQHTAGADSRQYRHVLANPELQKRFRMIAWDLPCHGRSLPPIGERWWEGHYRPSKAELMGWTTAIVESLALDRPIYLGCSVGGHLALDLAAHHPEAFRAFVAVNGAYELRSLGTAAINRLHRLPRISNDFAPAMMLAVTSPLAPEASAQEVYWVYRSNVPGVYAGDNDYYFHEHDLREDGHLIDPDRAPVYVVSGEYEWGLFHREGGGQAVADQIPGVVHRVLPGLGHFAPADDPVRFCEAILPILDEVISRCS